MRSFSENILYRKKYEKSYKYTDLEIYDTSRKILKKNT